MRHWGRWILAAAVAALLLGNSGARRLIRNALELRRADRSLAGLKQEEAALRKDLNALKRDDSRLETVARRDLGLLKPGEVEYRFNNDAKK